LLKRLPGATSLGNPPTLGAPLLHFMLFYLTKLSHITQRKKKKKSSSKLPSDMVVVPELERKMAREDFYGRHD
jgi:hypothetical protein